MPNGIANNATICYYTTGQGLRKDCEIVKQQLLAAGWRVNVLEVPQRSFPDWFYRLRSEVWDRLIPRHLKLLTLLVAQFLGRTLIPSGPDLVIFLERLHFPTLIRAKRACLIPNQEWYPERETYALKALHAVLCKTRHAEALFRRHSQSVCFIGFTSVDNYLPASQRDYRKYIHIAGKSRQKGTQALVEVWKKHPEWPPLLVVYQHDIPTVSSAPNITQIRRVLPEKDIRELQNTHSVHICLSEVEGFGHYIVEAMSCKALVVTTDAPPMNEVVTQDRGSLTRVKGSRPQSLGIAYSVDKEYLELTLEKVISMPLSEKAGLGESARSWYLQNQITFSSQFAETIKGIVPGKSRTLGVAHEQ